MIAHWFILSLLCVAAMATNPSEKQAEWCQEMSSGSCEAVIELSSTLQSTMIDVDNLVSKAVVNGTKRVTSLYKAIIRQLSNRTLARIRSGKISPKAVLRDLNKKKAAFKQLINKSIKDILSSLNSTDKMLHKIFARAILKNKFRMKGLEDAVNKVFEAITNGKDSSKAKDEVMTRFRRDTSDHIAAILSGIHDRAKAAIKNILEVVKGCLGKAREFVEIAITNIKSDDDDTTAPAVPDSTDAEHVLAEVEAEDEMEKIANEAEAEVEVVIGHALEMTEVDVEIITTSVGHEIHRRDLTDDIIMEKLKFFLGIFGQVAGPDFHRLATTLIQNNRAEITGAIKGGYLAMLGILPKFFPFLG